MTDDLLSNDLMGWVAALLTLLTFACHDMRRLRLLALGANATFIAYGALSHLLPVLVMHLALVPVNLWRLVQTLRAPLPRCHAACPALQPQTVGACTVRSRRGPSNRRHPRAGTRRARLIGSRRAVRSDPTSPPLLPTRVRCGHGPSRAPSRRTP